MSPLRQVVSGYRNVPRPIISIITAQFFVQGVNTAFFLLLNYYMAREGFADFEVADVLSYRFLAVFLLAFPIGLFIKGRKLKPFFLAATLLTPITSHLMLWSIAEGWGTLLNLSAMAWGLAFTCMQVTVLPYLLLNAPPKAHSEAISLSFLSFSATICLVGFLNFALNRIAPDFFTEQRVLQLVSTFALVGAWFVFRVKTPEEVTPKIPFRKIWQGYDWKAIAGALAPTLIIAIGAGFTIPVINLFFLNIHDLPSRAFSLVGAGTFLLVAIVVTLMPYIKRTFGYRIAITGFQTASILALAILATTEYYAGWQGALGVAIAAYIIRQPLMSAAAPMTSELTMYYVGPKNQEIMSALNASIWSGSWFISMKLFGWLRQMDFRYVSIFLITVGLYVIGVAWYAWLIHKYERKKAPVGAQLAAAPCRTAALSKK
ncbi:MFS transporter [Phaeodactylibacter luteus]|uniref:MFS transporter n=1 Tax=Phaeodactylibacter luteus TaxID=1564516 RepID=A0A5C6S4W0_9BACT|nr:MFS transporter [Phaeodactylibacter luteus]TXB68851.1 MFS transporter [Phaeodactylibacter luteus]